MPQGKLKVKTKLPASAKTKKKKATKGPAITKRINRPVPKKALNEEAEKLKKSITKNVNSAMENELRAKALDGKTSLISKTEALNKGNANKKQKKTKNTKS